MKTKYPNKAVLQTEAKQQPPEDKPEETKQVNEAEEAARIFALALGQVKQ